MSEQAQLHTLRRTSPKGPGQKFIGTCILCGAAGLTIADMSKPCPNQRGLSQGDALIEVLESKETAP